MNTPIIIYDMSFVDDYIKTFFERTTKNRHTNDLVFKSIKPMLEGKPVLFTTDAVFHQAKSRYPDRALPLDTLWQASTIEPLSIEDHLISVLTLASLKSLESRPVKFITLDTYLKQALISKPPKPIKFEIIDAESALRLIS
ncbi:MAG: hypothetical protein AB1529_04960 [Candidatus Micrarchaeota archaeon]